jgi:hypothetical protein
MKASPCRRGDLVELGLEILVINIWHTTVSDKMKMNIMEASMEPSTYQDCGVA